LKPDISLATKTGHFNLLPTAALEAFQELFARSVGEGRVFVNINGEPLKGYKHWFVAAVQIAGIRDFTW